VPKALNHVITSNQGLGKIITGPEACIGPPVIILAERPRPRIHIPDYFYMAAAVNVGTDLLLVFLP
jgi:hypothetical protein